MSVISYDYSDDACVNGHPAILFTPADPDNPSFADMVALTDALKDTYGFNKAPLTFKVKKFFWKLFH